MICQLQNTATSDICQVLAANARVSLAVLICDLCKLVNTEICKCICAVIMLDYNSIPWQ